MNDDFISNTEDSNIDDSTSDTTTKGSQNELAKNIDYGMLEKEI